MSARGPKNTADKYWSLIVRARGFCERCGSSTGPFQAAHLIRRAHVGDPDLLPLRTNLDNGVCLDAECHRIVDNDPVEMTRLVEQTIGLAKYLELMAVKNGRHRPWRDRDWVAERDRLRELWKELGA